MSFWYERFGTVDLPIYDPAQEQGPGSARLALMELPDGGAYDAHGAEQAPQDTEQINVKLRIMASSAADMRTQINELRALIGERDKLYRRQDDDDSVEWCWARLRSVKATRTHKEILNQAMTLTFVRTSPHWYGINHGAWLLDDGEYLDAGLMLDAADFTFTLDSSPKTVTVTNGGNLICDDPIITVTAGSASITNLVIEKLVGATTYGHIVYAGTIAIGKSLVIDCAARTVTNDSTSDYANFSLGASHKNPAWIRLSAAADNSIKVTLTGGSTDSTIDFAFYDAWA